MVNKIISLKLKCSVEFLFQGFDITVLEPSNDFGGSDNVGIRGNDQKCSFRARVLLHSRFLTLFYQEKNKPNKHKFDFRTSILQCF